jgi:hypothetical protein
LSITAQWHTRIRIPSRLLIPRLTGITFPLRIHLDRRSIHRIHPHRHRIVFRKLQFHRSETADQHILDHRLDHRSERIAFIR